jgi:glycosyltransferase involved in cell wall biosynthesis
VGTGPEEERLRQRIEELDLGGTVELLGPRPQGEVRRVIAGAAVLAAPCTVGADGNRDGMPTVLLEAMALGTPCVATPVTGIPEAIHDEHTGLLVPEHDPTALASALERLLADSDLRRRLAGAARYLVEQEFEVHRQAGELRRHFVARSADLALEHV